LSFIELTSASRHVPNHAPLNSNSPSTSTRSLSRSTRSPQQVTPRAQPRPWPHDFAPRASAKLGREIAGVAAADELMRGIYADRDAVCARTGVTFATRAAAAR